MGQIGVVPLTLVHPCLKPNHKEIHGSTTFTNYLDPV